MLIIIGLLVSAVYFGLKFFQKSQSQALTWWGLWEPESIVRPVLDEFEKSHPGLKVTYVFQSLSEYRERLKTALSQGRGPDIFRLHASWVPMFRDDLSPVPGSVYTTQAFESTFYPAVKDTLRVGTNYVAVPLEYDGLAMFVNDDLLSSAGLSAPATWDDLRTTALTISRCDTKDRTCHPGNKIEISGAALGSTENIDHWQDIVSVLMLQNNVSLAVPGGKPAEDVFDYYRNFTRAYGIWDPTLPSSTSMFASGKVGIYFGHSWRVFDIKKLNPQLKFSIHPIPQLPVDPSRGEKPINWASYWVEGVNSKSPNGEAAWELLKYMSSPEVLEKLNAAAISPDRPFGEPYSRVDLADKLAGDSLVGPFIKQAPLARGWYMASATSDGPTGLNTLLSQAYANALSRKSSVTALSSEINKILSQYGLAAPIPAGQ